MIALAPHWPALCAAVEGAAAEVAGWIDAGGVTVARTASGPTGFAFADEALLALARARPLALFHSHPDGRAALSDADRAAWAPGGVALHPWPQLVVATRGGRACEAALFAWTDGGPACVGRWVRRADGAWPP